VARGATRAAFVLFWILVLAGQACADGPADRLEDRVWDLRCAGRYAEAGAAADTLVGLLCGTDESPDCRAARYLHATVLHVAGLPPEAQAEIARCDTLDGTLIQCRKKGLFQRGREIARDQLAVRRRWLGQDHQEVADALYELARLEQAAGETDRADSLLTEALAIRRQWPHPGYSPLMNTLNRLANLRYGQREFAAAGRFWGEAAQVSAALEGPASRSTMIKATHQALALRQAGLEEQAVAAVRAHLERAEPLLEGGNRQTAGLYYELGWSLQNLTDWQAADEALVVSLKQRLAAGPGAEQEVLDSLHKLALVRQERGDLASARLLLEQVVFRLRGMVPETSPLLAVALNNLANLLKEQGKYGAAEPLFAEAIAIIRGQEPVQNLELARFLDNLAAMERARTNLERARELYQEALNLREIELGPEDLQVGHGLNNLGLLLADMGDHEAALPLLERAMVVKERHLDARDPEIANAQANLAKVLFLRGVASGAGSFVRAEELCRQALDLREAELGPRHRFVSLTLTRLASIHLAQGDLGEAESVLARSAGIYDEVRLRGGTGRDRATLEIPNPYPVLAWVRLERGDSAGAWSALQTARARSLAELMARRGEGRGCGPRTQPGLAELIGVDPGDTLLTSTETINPLSPELPPHTAVVGWCAPPPALPSGQGHVFCKQGAEAPRWFKLDKVEVGQEIPAAGRLRELLSQRGGDVQEIQRLGRELFQQYLAPLEADLARCRNLVIIPSGDLLGVPFSVLRNSRDQQLNETHRLSYAPSATILGRLLAKHGPVRSQAPRALLLGDPPYCAEHRRQILAEQASSVDLERARGDMTRDDMTRDDMTRDGLAWNNLVRSAVEGDRKAIGELPRLPATRDEVLAIAGHFADPLVLLGEEVTEERLRELACADRLRDFSILHLATHALVDNERFERSALVLAQDEEKTGFPTEVPDYMASCDGVLTTQEIVEQWRLDAGLVVLSACESGLGRKVAQEGFLGFSHALLEAGTRCLLVSLWSVDDRATSLLMQRFYGNLAEEGMSPQEALQEAKIYLAGYRDRTRRKPYAHPYYWSAFVLIGAAD
jgi:CHAT domain-containing protein/tetratricopeptide (TPR) repeat protein